MAPPLHVPSALSGTTMSAKLAESLRVTLARFNRRLRRQHSAGLPHTLVAVLAAVEHTKFTIGELAAREHMQPATMTGAVQKLKAQGLVDRLTDERDGRVVWVQITDAGREVLAERRFESNAYLIGLLTKLTDQEREVLSRAVAVLEGVLDEVVSDEREMRPYPPD